MNFVLLCLEQALVYTYQEAGHLRIPVGKRVPAKIFHAEDHEIANNFIRQNKL